MPVLQNIRFQKLDAFLNPIFIANSKEPLLYDDLKDKAQKLNDKKFGTFLPIYHSEEHEYVTIRFFKDNKYKFEEGCTYNIEYSIKTKSKYSKTYCNCYIELCKFVARTIRDDGEELEL